MVLRLGRAQLRSATFDGVHAGHRRLLRRTVEVAKENGWHSSVLTFHPHPTKVVAPERAPKLLNTTEQRWEFMEAEGIEQVFVLPFDLEFSRLTPEEFARKVLVDGAGAACVLVGHNFRFGAKHAGDVALLKLLGEKMGFLWKSCRVFMFVDEWRQAPKFGTSCRLGMYRAPAVCWRVPTGLEGRIVSGHGVGLKQTVPTLNLDTTADVIPADGVYITRTTDRG